MMKIFHLCMVVLTLFVLLAIALFPVDIYSTAPAKAAAKSVSPKYPSLTGHNIPEDVPEGLYTYLPIILKPCPDFFDNFSNPDSGWWVGEDASVRAEYLNGEYRVLSKSDLYFYPFRAPTCERENYIVEMDARWVGETGYSYGIIFGVKGSLDEFYLFEVNTDYQGYILLRYDSSDYSQVAGPNYSSQIYAGTASNHMKAILSGNQISLYVNGIFLGTWFDSVITGLTSMGLFSSPYDDYPISDARFDNFRVSFAASADELFLSHDKVAEPAQMFGSGVFGAQTHKESYMHPKREENWP